MLQALRRCFSPFGHLRDAGSGSFEQRAAAARHNRRMRAELFSCMLRWALSCAIALGLTVHFEALGGGARGSPGLAILAAAACATFIACGVCVLLVSAYVYVRLVND